ncbi:hypothetical protein [Brevundimonas sp. TWP2-3-4b1]|uniref:hypothetical protein n=1 Tax=Brevundimonas sp. TWP2-3-4b1 TaxID=2804580 RepID=UPI003CEF991B
MRGVVLAALIATPALAGSQSLSDQIRLFEFEGGQAVVRVHVLRETPYEGAEITIYAPRRGPAGSDPTDDKLSAIAVYTRAAPQVARSETCPGLRTSLQTLRAIPAVRGVPTALNPRPPILRPIEPTKKDGQRYEITMDVSAPGRGQMLMTVNDYNGGYASWGDELVQNLAPCWTVWR